MSLKNHPYHLVDPSPWPIVTSMAALTTTVGLVLYVHHHTLIVTLLGVAFLIACMAAWWRDVLIESAHEHTHTVQQGLRLGMAFFITSEVMFFAAFFWSFFDASLFPPESIGSVWPPKNIEPIDAFHLPYLNTLLLLLSATSLTWAHEAIKEKNAQKAVLQGLMITIALGFIFTLVQVYEYAIAMFTIKDGIFGSNFYMITGFHGVHVIIGTIFLLVCLIRAKRGRFTPTHHVGFDAAAWYWHFVDVVWLFVFVFVYWWGS